MGGLSAHNPGFATGNSTSGIPDGRKILYDEHSILVFNHPDDSSVSAIHDIDDPEPDHLDYLNDLKQVGDLTQEELNALSLEAMVSHNEFVNKLHDEKDEMIDMMAGYNPYGEGIRVLDTDYDKYLILYHCTQNDPEDQGEAQEDGISEQI